MMVLTESRRFTWTNTSDCGEGGGEGWGRERGERERGQEEIQRGDRGDEVKKDGEIQSQTFDSYMNSTSTANFKFILVTIDLRCNYYRITFV